MLSRYRDYKHAAFGVTVEDIPAAGRGAPFVKPYLDAIFSVDGVAVVPEPVRTMFGWHAIAVTAIEPAYLEAFETAANILRPELRTEKRKMHVEALMEALRRQVGVEVDADAVARLRTMAP